MRRRPFVGALATSAGSGLLAGYASSRDATPNPTAQPATLKPPRLRKGDTVGLIAPAGPLRRPAELENAKHQAELLGVRLVLGDHIYDRYGYLAGSDAARAEDFNRFARDPQVRAIFSLRGGYGTMRILDAIDYAALTRDPKIVLGFSDLTALLNAITARTGLITFHGPVGISTPSPGAISGIRRAVMSGEPLGTMHVPQIGTLSGGVAHGRLVGGNLSLVAALCGTRYAVPCAGNILVLEEIDEAPYHIDRMLTQLLLSGDLPVVAGIALGNFRNSVAPGDDNLPSLTIDETLRDRLAGLKKPLMSTLLVGHIKDQWTVPLGMPAAFDGDAGTLVIEEPAVS